MTRIDIPTLKCDRCGKTTQDTEEMGKYITIRNQWYGYDSKQSSEWDLCAECYGFFQHFINDTSAVATVDDLTDILHDCFRRTNIDGRPYMMAEISDAASMASKLLRAFEIYKPNQQIDPDTTSSG